MMLILVATKIEALGPCATPHPPKVSSKSDNNFWSKLCGQTNRKIDRPRNTTSFLQWSCSNNISITAILRSKPLAKHVSS